MTLINTRIIVLISLRADLFVYFHGGEAERAYEPGIWRLQVPPVLNYSGDQSGLRRALRFIPNGAFVCVVACERDKGYKMRLVSATWRLHLAACINKNIMSCFGTVQDDAGKSASPCSPSEESLIALNLVCTCHLLRKCSRYLLHHGGSP